MSRLMKFVIRWGLIAAVVTGGLVLLVGPERVSAVFGTARQHAMHFVDRHLDDPAAMRHHLRALADRYPDQISEVRGELATIQCQAEQFRNDSEIADQVVRLTTTDLQQLATAVRSSQGGIAPVSFVIEGRRLNLEEAREDGRRVRTIQASYQDRIASNTHHLELLSQQEQRLTEILARLESEYSEYTDQLWQLDRQIDMIERNDRLIEITESQKATLRDFDRFGRISNLDQVESKLAEIRAVQEGTLQALSGRGMHEEYEARARRAHRDGGENEDPFADVFTTPADDPIEAWATTVPTVVSP